MATSSAIVSGYPNLGDGTVSAPGLAFQSDSDTGIYRIGANTIGIATNGTRVGEIGVGYGGFTGNVIQVQSTTKTDTFSTTSTSFTDITGLSIAITPKYTTSKILLIAHLTAGKSIDIVLQFRFERGGTGIGIGDAGGASQPRATTGMYVGGSVSAAQAVPVILQFYDSPTTTSAITYKVQMLVDTGTGYVGRTATDSNSLSYGRQISTITAIEVQQ